MRTPTWISQHWAALRAVVAFTIVLGIGYPLLITGVAQIPGLSHPAGGSLVTADGRKVGSALVGQLFTDSDGIALPQYFQSRPSEAGDGYDPTSTSASNLGPENVVDTLPDPSVKDDSGTQSLLTEVCTRSLAVGKLEGVSGARPYCTADGVGAVLGVFYANGTAGPKDGKPITSVVSLNQACPAAPFVSTYRGVPVKCATFSGDYTHAVITPIHGGASSHPAVPSDAVTASGSGLDPQISPAYAALQAPRIARVRGADTAAVNAIIKKYTVGRGLGFMGEPGVDVLQMNLALNRQFPYQGK